MKIQKFEKFLESYFNKTQNLTYIKQPVEIRIDVEKVTHAGIRQFRHVSGGNLSSMISNDEIIETVELAIEELTISLMQDEFDIYQEVDGYPCPDVKEGEPSRFVIRNTTTGLNIVCQLEPGDNEFTLTVITVMNKPDFKVYPGQFVINVQS
jgi:hypothetical protein